MSAFDNSRCGEAIIRVSEGDMNGLTVLYEQLGRQIFSLAMSVTNNYQDAEDVMQDTFVRVCSASREYRRGGNARAWVMAIARNAAVDRSRARARLVPSADASFVQTSPDVAEVCALNDLMNCLEETDRQIVVMKAVDGMRFSEIAEVVGLTPAAAQKRYRRAVAKLRSL